MRDIVLPRVPSRLIRLALLDLQATERDARYTIDMHAWHVPADEADEYDDKRCHVCLAGAVIAQSFEARPNAYVMPSELGYEANACLTALNAFRTGDIGKGLWHLLVENPDRWLAAGHNDTVVIADYDQDEDAFYTDMEALAAKLEAVGL